MRPGLPVRGFGETRRLTVGVVGIGLTSSDSGSAGIGGGVIAAMPSSSLPGKNSGSVFNVCGRFGLLLVLAKVIVSLARE